MTRRTHVVLAAVAAGLIALAPARSAAQTTAAPRGDVQELRLRDGSVLYGYVDARRDDVLVFRTVAGAAIEVPSADVLSLAPARGEIVRGEFIPADPNATRLFFTPTGRSLRRGHGYIGMFEIMMPFVQVGVTDRISIGGGTPPFIGINEGDRPFWVTPKVQVLDRPRTKAAVGVLHIANVGDASAGIAYGVVTMGAAHAAVTVGLGAGYAEDDDSSGVAAIVMIGGERRLRRGIKFVTENYLWKGADGLLSGGFRFYGERLSADLGLFVPLGAGDLFAFPVVNFVWTF